MRRVTPTWCSHEATTPPSGATPVRGLLSLPTSARLVLILELDLCSRLSDLFDFKPRSDAHTSHFTTSLTMARVGGVAGGGDPGDEGWLLAFLHHFRAVIGAPVTVGRGLIGCCCMTYVLRVSHRTNVRIWSVELRGLL